MKYFLIITFVVCCGNISFAQQTIEDQVADTACACLSAIDSTKINSNSNGLKMACLQEAMIKNNESIVKTFETEKRREEDEEKRGLKGSLMIKVQNILAERCKSYQLFEQKVQERRTR